MSRTRLFNNRAHPVREMTLDYFSNPLCDHRLALSRHAFDQRCDADRSNWPTMNIQHRNANSQHPCNGVVADH